MRLALALAAALLTLAVFPAVSPAPVPPRDCNFMTVKGKQYNIKADRIRCKKARKVSRRLLKGGRAKGFTCQANPTAEIRYYCRKGRNTYIYVIRR